MTYLFLRCERGDIEIGIPTGNTLTDRLYDVIDQIVEASERLGRPRAVITIEPDTVVWVWDIDREIPGPVGEPVDVLEFISQPPFPSFQQYVNGRADVYLFPTDPGLPVLLKAALRSLINMVPPVIVRSVEFYNERMSGERPGNFDAYLRRFEEAVRKFHS